VGGCDGVEVTRDKHTVALAGILLVLGIVLFATAPRGLFSIDESSYIASITGLRDGDLDIAASAKLAPSPELYAFDAAPKSRPIKTPVTSASPPLFAPIALPFSFGGMSGLMVLQILSFLVCAAFVFVFARRYAKRVELAWLAMVVFLVGSFALEYAQAIWPHALAMALVMGAFELASRCREGRSAWFALVAGACVALAAGLRYQNIVVVATVGGGLLLVPRARLRTTLLAFTLGAAPLIFASAAMNKVRHDSWNPVSKGGTYLLIAGEKTTSGHVVEQAITSTWSRIVDYSTWPTPTVGMSRDASGAIILDGRFKKALLQSSPWALLPLLAILLSLRKRRTEAHAESTRELRAIGLVVAGTIGMFAVYGYRRYDGWCFNQRYLLELMPLLSIGLVLALARVTFSMRSLVTSATVTTVAVFVLLQLDHATWRSTLAMKFPILIAVLVGAVWIVTIRGAQHARALGAIVGIAIGWSVAMQLGDDLAGSRARRAYNTERLLAIEAVLPREPLLLFAYWGDKDPFGSLLLDRDLLVIDPWIDAGKTARSVVDSALATGRRVFALPMPTAILASMSAGLRIQRVPGTSNLLELAP
jgi:hypothetical protein